MAGLHLQTKIVTALAAFVAAFFCAPCFAQFAAEGQPGSEYDSGTATFTECTIGDPAHRNCKMKPPQYLAPLSTPPQTMWWGPEPAKRGHLVSACEDPVASGGLGGTLTWGPTFFGSLSHVAGEPNSKKYQDAFCVTGPASAPVYTVIGRFYLGDVQFPMPPATCRDDNGLPNYTPTHSD